MVYDYVIDFFFYVNIDLDFNFYQFIYLYFNFYQFIYLYNNVSDFNIVDIFKLYVYNYIYKYIL